MKTLKKLSLVLILIAGFTSLTAFTDHKTERPPNNWVKLGMRTVDMKADHDVIMVTAHDGFFTKLKFKILKAPLYIKNARVVFGNGNDKNIVFNKRFPQGSETRVIDLPGNKRIIKKIVFNYKTAKTGHGNGKAIVVAWGRH